MQQSRRNVTALPRRWERTEVGLFKSPESEQQVFESRDTPGVQEITVKSRTTHEFMPIDWLQMSGDEKCTMHTLSRD